MFSSERKLYLISLKTVYFYKKGYITLRLASSNWLSEISSFLSVLFPVMEEQMWLRPVELMELLLRISSVNLNSFISTRSQNCISLAFRLLLLKLRVLNALLSTLKNFIKKSKLSNYLSCNIIQSLFLLDS